MHWLFQMKLLCSSHLNLRRGSIFFAAQVTPVARKRAFTVSVHVFVQCWLPSKKLAASWTVVMLLVNKVNTCNNTTYKFLRFSQQHGSGLHSSRGWCCVNGWLVPSVSKEHSVCECWHLTLEDEGNMLLLHTDLLHQALCSFKMFGTVMWHHIPEHRRPNNIWNNSV